MVFEQSLSSGQTADRVVRVLVILLIFVPLLCFVMKAVNLAVYAVDIPYYDDWREFDLGTAGSFELHTLFEPANDTLYPVGKALDSLFIRFLNGNVIVYQVLSLVVILGLLLWLQFCLLRRVIDHPIILAAAFFSTILMLQPGSYWGAQYIAYHQAIPAVCILAILLLALGQSVWWRSIALFILSLIAGFAYISGAFASTALAVVFLLHGLSSNDSFGRQMRHAGLFVGMGGAVTLVAQLRVILVHQDGGTHRPDTPWALPTDLDFWLYMLGKVGRALSLPSQMPSLSLAITLLVLILALAASVYTLMPYWRWLFLRHQKTFLCPSTAAKDQCWSVVLLSLIAVIGIYLCLVAAGRANVRSPEIQSSNDIFLHGFQRFHFFWVTLLIPWLVAACLNAVERVVQQLMVTIGTTLIIISWIFVNSLKGDVFSQTAYYKHHGNHRSATLMCIASHIRAGHAHIGCPNSYPRNLLPAYLNAVADEISFTRYLPPPDALPFVAKNTAILFQLDQPEARQQLTFRNTALVDVAAEPLLKTRQDPQIEITLDDAKAAACSLIQVTVSQTIEAPSTLQVYYLPRSEKFFSKPHSVRAPLLSGSVRKSLFLKSDTGFEPLLRIDPVTDAQTVALGDISIGCLR